MGTRQRLTGPIYLEDEWEFQQIKLPKGAVGNDEIANGAGLDATKLEHAVRTGWSAESAADMDAAEKHVIHLCRGTSGKVVKFSCGVCVKPSDSYTVTVQLKKNNTQNVLSAAIVFDNNSTNYAVVDGTLDAAHVNLSAGDVLEVVLTVAGAAGTRPKGFFSGLITFEDSP